MCPVPKYQSSAFLSPHTGPQAGQKPTQGGQQPGQQARPRPIARLKAILNIIHRCEQHVSQQRSLEKAVKQT
ncbi:MAG: hypothetical protein A2V46_00815 [Bacteroidetes bacterium RBG_19FT_COMBO_42_7]|nr:MAG: hypothetical protein A2V46_00815 [Bacteroidetes bacterium RBG_19FT_COMBO_42_7]